MRRYKSLKSSIVSAAVLCLAWTCVCAGPAHGGWQLAVTFTTTSPGGDLKFDPQHVQVVWVEDASGVFVKTIGRWGLVEHRHLTQWMAVDGTNLDGWTGATPKAYQQHTAVWNLTDRSGAEVPDGTYSIRFELTNQNAEKNQFRRTVIAFVKDGVPRSQFYGSQDGYLNISVDYTFTPTKIPAVAVKPAAYVTSSSARLVGRVTDTGGEDPNVTIYWGENDAGVAASRWNHSLDLGPQEAGELHVDLADLDPSTQYHYRLYAQNSAGGRWSDETAGFSTHGATGYYAGYRVQSGRARVEGLRLDIDILPVSDTLRAFALISCGTGWQPDAENANAVMVRGYLLDTGTVRIERTSPANSTWVSWQVIECLGREFQAYRGSGTFTADESSIEAALNGVPAQGDRRTAGGSTPAEVVVDPSRCIAYVTADTSAADRLYYHEALLTAYVNTNKTVRIDRAGTGHSTVKYNWVVVEFAPGAVASVQHGSLNFTGPTQGAPASRKIQPVNPASSLLLHQTRSTVNGLAYSAVAGRLVSSNTVQFYQHTGTTGTRFVEYHVIDFGPSALAQRGQVNFSDDSSWFFADCLLTQPVDVSAAMHFHSLSCNGTGDFYPRPFATAEFVDGNVLRVERQFPGQQSYIEWQVLELPAATFFGQVPDIDLSPSSLAFPATSAGGYADLTFEIRNTGTGDLHVRSLEFVGLNKTAYSLPAPVALPLTIPASGAGATLTVRFAPAAIQSYDYARLAVGSDDPDEPVAELSLWGTADGAGQ